MRVRERARPDLRQPRTSLGKQPDHRGEECPPHRIEVRDTYWITTTEVSNEVFARFDPGRPRAPWSSDDRQPAVALSFEEAARFCAWLSERNPGFVFRLPTETEWELACRAGSGARFGFGENEADLPRCSQDWSSGPWAIGAGRPNDWGLKDLHGNAWEWCTGEPGNHHEHSGAEPGSRSRVPLHDLPAGRKQARR